MTNGSACDAAVEALGQAERAARVYAEALEEAQRDAERAIEDARDAQDRIDRATERIEAAQTRRANAELRASAARTELSFTSLTGTPSPFAESSLAAAESEIFDAAADEAAARRDLEQARDDLERAKRRGERAEEAARDAARAAAGVFGGAAAASPAVAFYGGAASPFGGGESFGYRFFHKQFNPFHPQHSDYEEGRVWWDYGTGVIIGGSAQSAKYFSQHWMREVPGYWARERTWIAPYTRSTPSGGTTTVRGHYRGGQWVGPQTLADDAARAQWAGRAQWIGRGGNVLAVGAAGLDQWVEDSNRTDLTTTDRVGRTAGAATFVGGVSVAGGMAGAALGAKGGALAGAAIGSVIPIVGTGAGAAVGGVVGAIGGGIVGSGLANAAANEVKGFAVDAGQAVANGAVDGFNAGVDLATDTWEKTEGRASGRGTRSMTSRPTSTSRPGDDRRAAAPRRRRAPGGVGAGVDGAVAGMVAAHVHRPAAAADHAPARPRLRAGRRRALRAGRARGAADPALPRLPRPVRDVLLGALMVGARLVPGGAACRGRARPVRSRHGAELRRAHLEARGRRQPAAVAERFGGREPIRRWKATWIEHENGGEKPHALGRAGATDGRLELYDDGLAFRASGIEDRMRRDATAVAISREEFGTARVVPAGAGPDGQKRPRHGARSAFARLVVDTQYGPFLFEVNSAKRKAREISETLGSGW